MCIRDRCSEVEVAARTDSRFSCYNATLPLTLPLLCRLILDAAAAQSYRVFRSRLLGLKAFLATAFLMLGDYNVVLGMTLERHISRIGQKAAVHEHGIT